MAIAFGVTAAAWGIVEQWPRGGGQRPGSYGSWLARLVPVPADLVTAAGVTAQLAAAALLVALTGGLVLAGLARWRRAARAVTGLGLGLMAVAGPTLGIVAWYWLILRFDVGLRPGAVSILDDGGRAVDRLVLPALAAGLPVAPTLAALLTPARSGEPRWWTALAAPLASRGPLPRPDADPTRPARPVGLPVGLLAAGLAASELIFDRPGLFALVGRSALEGQPRAALDAVAALAVAGALAALAVDLVVLALRPVAERRRQRHPAPRAGTEVIFAAGRGPAVPTARPVRVAVVLLAGLAVGGTLGLVLAPHPAPDPRRAFGGPLLDGVLGADAQGRDLLALTAGGLGRTVAATAGSALVAALLALALAPLVRRLPRVGQLVPGVAVDALWWPASLVGVLVLPAVGVRGPGLIHPVVLALTGLALVPVGLRLAAATRPPGAAGRGLHALALWLLLAPLALTGHLVASFAGLDSATGPSLGRQLADSLPTLGRSQWPAVWPALAAALLAAACAELGSSLLALAHQQAGRRPDPDDEPWALSMRAVHDEHPWFDGTDGTDGTDGEPTPQPTEELARTTRAERDIHVQIRDDDEMEEGEEDEAEEEHEDEGEPAGAPAGLAPNFSLQPGLPPPELNDTMRLPVVRVRLAPDDSGA